MEKKIIDKPAFIITSPKIQRNFKNAYGDLILVEIYDYDNSHVIYKNIDLGSFKEILQYKELINSLSSRIEHLENDYYHALAVLTGNEFFSERKKNSFEKEYEELQKIRVKRILEHKS